MRAASDGILEAVNDSSFGVIIGEILNQRLISEAFYVFIKEFIVIIGNIGWILVMTLVHHYKLEVFLLNKTMFWGFIGLKSILVLLNTALWPFSGRLRNLSLVTFVVHRHFCGFIEGLRLNSGKIEDFH